MVRTARLAQRTTSRSISGFTLVEVLIAMAIIVLVMAMGLPAITRVTYQRVSSQSRRFVGLTRTIRNDSILLSNIHRLVIDIDNSQWWVESQKQNKLLADENEESFKKKQDDKKRRKDEPVESNFAPSTKFSSKPIPLPDGVSFDGVLKEKEGLIQNGVAYIHFFPSGFVEQSIIYINKTNASSKGYSVLIRPTAGRVEVYNKHLENFDEQQ